MSYVLWALAAVTVAVFAAQTIVRGTFIRIGRKALGQQPDEVTLEKLSVAGWADPVAADALANPLIKLGFADLGDFAVDKMPGVRMRILVKPDAAVAAFIYEHLKAGTWIELSVRYEDGTTTALVNRPPTGIQSPPFFRKIYAEKGVPTDQLYERLLKERPPQGIKAITAETVIPEFEDAFRRIMFWQKNKGLSAEEVAAVAKTWARKKAPKAPDDEPRRSF